MAISDSMALMALTVVLICFTLKNHPLIQGILVIVTGITTYLWLPTNNPYGYIIMALGVGIILFSPTISGKENTGRR